jgi:hypothetical protein
VIKVLESWLTPEEFVGFLKGNVIKYQARAQEEGWCSGLRQGGLVCSAIGGLYEERRMTISAKVIADSVSAARHPPDHHADNVA